MGMSFKEGLQWIILISVLLVYGVYFSQAGVSREADVTAREIIRFSYLTGLLIVLNIVGASVLASFKKYQDKPADERDRLIQWKSQSVASYVLTSGVLFSMACAHFFSGNSPVLHALLGSLVVTQVVDSGLQIFYYRRGY